MPVYLDNAATTKPCAPAVDAAVAAMTVNFGNPSSLHRAGLDAQLVVDRARKIIADSVGASPENIIFTSGSTESNNLALRGASAAYGRKRRKIVVSAVEHASVDETASALEKSGFEVVRISPREDGKIYAADFLAASRCAGRYVLSISQGVASFAVVNSVVCSGSFSVFPLLLFSVVLSATS